MINDTQKYDVAKRIFQAWNHKTQDFREGMDDASIAKEAGVLEIDVRTIRWETVGDTHSERARAQSADAKTRKALEDLAYGFQENDHNAEKLIGIAEEQQEVWREILSLTADLNSILAKLPDPRSADYGTIRAAESKAYRKFTSLWRNLTSSANATSEMLEEVAKIGEKVGWSIE
jgi:hypothetical protein